MDGFITSTLTQLATQLPLMLVYLIGFILALFFIGRSRRSSICTLLGTGLLLLTTIATTLLQNYLIFSRAQMGWSQVSLSQILAVLAIVGSIFRAVAFALILIAIFTGRPKSTGNAMPSETKV